MPHEILTHQNGRVVLTQYDYDRLALAPGEFSTLAKASTSTFAEFVEPFLRDAAVFDPLCQEDRRYGCWRPMDPSRTTDLKDWLRRELITFGFLLEMSFSDLGIASQVTNDLSEIHNAFSALPAGRARLSIVDNKPSISELTVAPRTMLSPVARDLKFFGGDPVDGLHIMLSAEAIKTRPIPPNEVNALLNWADEEFVTYAIECLRGEHSSSKPFMKYSNAQNNVNALGIVVRGLCALEWSIDGPLFSQFPKRPKNVSVAKARPAARAGARRH